MTRNPVNGVTYCKILPQINEKGKDFILFGDNVAYNTFAYIKKQMEHYNTEFMKNV